MTGFLNFIASHNLGVLVSVLMAVPAAWIIADKWEG